MTRREDNKRGGPDGELSKHGQKVEARSTKDQAVKRGPDGQVVTGLNRDHADNTGGQGHKDIVADI